MTRRLLVLALAAPLLLLVGCVNPLTELLPQQAESGVLVEGNGWAAVFPGDVEESTQPFPVPGVQVELSADTTVWEDDSNALLVQVIRFPDDIGDEAETLLQTVASGEVVSSPVLDADGTFRGRPAVVVSRPQSNADVQMLAFFEGDRLYQLLHATTTLDSDHGELTTLAESFEFRE